MTDGGAKVNKEAVKTGELEAISSRIKGILLPTFESLWGQLWILMKTNQIINLMEVSVTLLAENVDF